MYAAPAIEPTTEMGSTEELHGTRPWNALTAKQRLWVETFIGSNGDAVLATNSAFDCASERNAKILSYEISANPKIRAALDLFYGRTERDSFVERLARQIADGSLTIAQWKGMNLLCRLKGWAAISADASSEAAAAKPETPAQFHVGDIVLIDGKKCRVNEVNKNGRPVDVDEVQ